MIENYYVDILDRDINWTRSAQGVRQCYTSAGQSTIKRRMSEIFHNHTMVDLCEEKAYHGFTSLFNFMESSTEMQVLYGYIYPVLLTISLLTNFLVVLVLSERSMRKHNTNVILLYMGVAELFVAVVPFPFLLFHVILRHNRHMEEVKIFWCWLRHLCFDAVPPFWHSLAIWLTVLLAAQRMIYVTWPLRAQKLCTMQRVRAAGVFLTLAAFLGSALKLISVDEFQLLRFELLNRTTNSVIWAQYQCIYKYARIVDVVGEDLYFSIYFWTRVVVLSIGPSVLLVILSAFLIYGIRKANRRRLRLLQENRRSEARRQNESNSTTSMLVWIVVIFLIVNLPQGVILAIYCVQEVLHQRFMDRYITWLAMHVDNLLILATYPVNFAIYCSMSAQFRATFKRIVLRRLIGNNSNATVTTVLLKRDTEYSAGPYSAVENGSAVCKNGNEKKASDASRLPLLSPTPVPPLTPLTDDVSSMSTL